MELTSIDGSTSVIEEKLFVTKLDGLEFNLPVCLLTDGHIADVTGIMALIDTSKDSLSTVCLGAANTESEHVLLQKLLVNHLEERRCHAVDGNGVVGKTEDTIEPVK